jgi:glucokinase
LAQAILVAIDADGVEFALPEADGGEAPVPDKVEAAAAPTFTDAIMGYADRRGVELRGCRLFVSVAGAMSAGAIRTTNGRWYISVAGLEALTGVTPRVVNDVTAIAYATLDDPRTLPFGGYKSRLDDAVRRSAVIFAGGGLGAAGIDRRGTLSILDSEAGHTPFAPTDDAEWALVQQVTRSHGWASYEQVAQALATATGELARDQLAIVLGRYAAVVTMAFGAWDGAYLCGPLFDQVARQGRSAVFRDAFEGRSKMRNLLRQAPTVTLQDRVSAIAGLAKLYGGAQANDAA